MDSTLISTRPDEGTLSLSRARRAALGSFAGAVVDWYDFLLYGITAALVFNREFFPQVSPAMGTLAAFATFGVGFLFRPLGGVIFGHFGDRLGRKRMLMLTVWMMGIATALIGILPSFSTIGWWAPILLVTLRAIQGFAVGGEWGGAALLSVESAPKNKKAFYSSGVQVGYGVGLLLSTGLVSLISMMTTDEQFLSWGWRIPFLFSIVLVLGALWVRNGMEESAEFEQQQHYQAAAKKRIPVIEALLRHPGAFLKIIALRLCELLTMYIVTAFALNYSTQNMGLPRELFLNIGLLVGGLSCLTIPCFAWLADRFGRRRVYITGALIGTLSAFPFFMALEAQSIFWIVFFSIMLANIAHDMVVCVQQPMFTEMFGASYRYSGAGVGYQVASVVGGGFTPFIAAALITYFAGNWHSVAIYLLAGCLISAMTVTWDGSTTNPPKTRAFGRFTHAGSYTTTITRPTLFRSYLNEQLTLLYQDYGAHISVQPSQHEIPYPYVIDGSELTLDRSMSAGLTRYFPTTELAQIGDETADGIYHPTEFSPLSHFDARRVDFSLARLRHYTGTPVEHFQPFVLFTNYTRYVDEFVRWGCSQILDPDSPYIALSCAGGNWITAETEAPEEAISDLAWKKHQMPAWHLITADGQGITLVNIGVGPSNAKTICDHLAVLRPDVWLMIGHCGGLRESQAIGDYVLAHAYLRDDHVLDAVLPPDIPIPSIAEVQRALYDATKLVSGRPGEEVKQRLRTGTVVTTDDRNWELRYSASALRFNLSRAVAIDMESATIAAQGYRFRVPYGTLLCVSDKPLHGEIKLPGQANRFYEGAISEHLQIGIRAIDLLRAEGDRLHSRKLRTFNEPPFR